MRDRAVEQPADLRGLERSSAVFTAPAPFRVRPLAMAVGPGLGARLVRNTCWSLAGTFIARTLGLLSAILLARILGRHDFGALGLAQGTISMFGIFAGCGTSLTATKHIAELRAEQPARAARILGLCTIVACAFGG